MIKARACAGDIAAGEAILNELSPFVWRKYLDFAAVADVHAMKRQINAYRGHGEIAVEGHNIKLGRGGIREIEFFAQTQQLIAGGRNPALRDRDTLTTLDKLAKDRWIDEAARDDMKAAYGFLRTVEHRLQMINDEQTQTLAGRARRSRTLRALSRLLPTAMPSPRFCSSISTRCSATMRACSKRRPAPTSRRWRFRPTPTTTRRWIGWPSSASARRWKPRRSSGIGLPAGIARSEARWRAAILRRCCRSCSSSWRAPTIPNAALVLFDHFLANLHSAARLLSLLRQNPDLIALIALVLGIAPRLADTLARNPQVMDALVDPSFFGALPDDDGARQAARRGARAIALRRGPARTHPHVRARIHVPDRRAHPVRHGDGAAGGRGLRAAGRRGDPRRASRGRRQFRRHARPYARRGDRGAGHGQARRARDDREFRSRPDPDLRFRRRSIRNRTASARSTARNISRG